MKHKILIISLTILSLFLITGCNNKNDDTSKINNRTIDSIIEEDNYIIVDVREKEEYEDGHVVGAINIPYETIDSNTSLDKNKTIIVYCKSGRRSGIAYQTLKKLGYDVFDLGAYDSITLDKE